MCVLTYKDIDLDICNGRQKTCLIILEIKIGLKRYFQRKSDNFYTKLGVFKAKESIFG